MLMIKWQCHNCQWVYEEPADLRIERHGDIAMLIITGATCMKCYGMVDYHLYESIELKRKDGKDEE